jgi:hypothetical protein
MLGLAFRTVSLGCEVLFIFTILKRIQASVLKVDGRLLGQARQTILPILNR